MENQHTMISGYRDLPTTDIDHINGAKNLEEDVAQFWQYLNEKAAADKRWLNIAKTHFQEGFSAMVRSIARPADPFAGGGE